MGIIQKQGFSSTLLNYSGVGIAYLNLIFILPLFLSLEEIGLVRLIVEIATLLMLVFQFGSPYLVIRYFPKFNTSERELRSFYLIAIAAAVLGIALMFVFYYFFRAPIITYFSEKSHLIADYEKTFFTIAIGLILFNVFERIFASKKIIVIPTLFKEVLFRIVLTIIVTLFGLKLISFNQAVDIWSITYLVAPLILFYLYKRLFGLKFNFSPTVWNSSNYKKFISYTSIVSLGAIGGGLSIKIDMLMTSSMLGLKELSIYATMVYIATVIEIPKRALVQISDPFISEFYSSGQIDKIGELYKKNSLVLLIFGLMFFLGIYFNLPYLFEIMPKGESFALGINVFLIIGVVKILSLLSGITNQILLNSVQAWVSSVTIIILAIMSIGLNYYFIPIYGLEGAAFATLLSVGVNHMLTMTYVYIKFKIHPFCKELGILTIVFLIFLAIGYFTPQLENPFVGIVVTSAIIGCLFPIIVWRLNLSEDANQLFRQVLNKVGIRL